MHKHEVEHILRAAGAVTNQQEFVIIGSQAILGSIDNPPQELIRSQELDIFSIKDENLSDLIDGSIGEMSPFHSQFGYYAHGVSEHTAILPGGWNNRLVKLNNENTKGVTGLCLSLPDLAVSKIIANRPRDREYVTDMFKNNLIAPSDIEALMNELESQHQGTVQFFLSRMSKN